MNDHYLTLFFATGAPIFYLLYCCECTREEDVKTAWSASQAELL